MIKILNKEKIDPGETPFMLFKNYFDTLPATVDENNNPQCAAGCLRTYEDLVQIFNYYYPDVEVRHFHKTLYDLIRRQMINCVWCNQIQAITYYPMGRDSYYVFRSLFIANSGYVYFNKKGVLSHYNGYGKDRYEEHKMESTLIRLGVEPPKWED